MYHNSPTAPVTQHDDGTITFNRSRIMKNAWRMFRARRVKEFACMAEARAFYYREGFKDVWVGDDDRVLKLDRQYVRIRKEGFLDVKAYNESPALLSRCIKEAWKVARHLKNDILLARGGLCHAQIDNYRSAGDVIAWTPPTH